MKYFLYFFFLTAGAILVSFGSFRPVHLSSLVLIFLTLCFARKTLFRVFKNHPIWTLLFGLWSLLLGLITAIGGTYWSFVDVGVFVTYTLVSASLAAWFIKLGHSFSYTTAAWLVVLGFFVSLKMTASIGLLDFFRSMWSAVAAGQSKILIFELFGRAGVLASGGFEFAAGLRHTVSALFGVSIFLVAEQSSRTRWTVSSVSVVAIMSFLIIAMQSRSTWVAIALGASVILFHRVRKYRLTPLRVVLGLAVISFVVVSAAMVWGLVATRMSDESSLVGREEYLLKNLGNIFRYGLIPVDVAQVHGSSHNFVVDSGVSGGLLGMIVAALFYLTILVLVFRAGRSSRGVYASAAALPLAIRLVTVGSGLPGVGGFIGFALLLAWGMSHRKSNAFRHERHSVVIRNRTEPPNASSNHVKVWQS